MIKTLYFSINAADDASDAADDALLINAANFIAMGCGDTTQATIMYFLDRANTGAAETKVTLTHAAGRAVDVMSDVCEAMSGEPKDGFIVIADPSNGDFCSPYITDASLAL